MNYKNIIVWIVTVFLSIIYIFFGHNIASKNLTVMDSQQSYSAKAIVLSIEDEVQGQSYEGIAPIVADTTTLFTCRLLEGEHKGEEILAAQIGDSSFSAAKQKIISVGDKIIVYNYPAEEYGTEWIFGNYVRFDTLMIFAATFFVLLLLFGWGKGINTIISLTFTCLAIFLVYIPSILSGQNIYISTLIACGFITIMTILITNGWSKKTLATILGCLFGVCVAACLSLIMDRVLHLTGVIDENSIYLTALPSPVNLNAIIFGSIVVGSLGAVMDVAMDIASSLYEICQHSDRLSFARLVKSGLTIGRDIMGTMSNTLVLAYIGSSLSVVLLLITYADSISSLINREMIIVEFIQALIGSTAILLTIPLTAIICGMIYIGKQKKPRSVRKQRIY
ncbi:YibE/F family protein [Anaerotignum sp.]|uniref:YibE/F family protein n=1 Tax=Anaerotignum sp. TaxID=2039241 RepID=UPI002714A11C|nr:YibE/F family protein [Anaerotignum sp.]